MPIKIYLVRQHVQVGDERILGATLHKNTAEDAAAIYRKKTKTENFDVVEVIAGNFPSASEVFS